MPCILFVDLGGVNERLGLFGLDSSCSPFPFFAAEFLFEEGFFGENGDVTTV
jgi:hypothetical protein